MHLLHKFDEFKVAGEYPKFKRRSNIQNIMKYLKFLKEV